MATISRALGIAISLVLTNAAAAQNYPAWTPPQPDFSGWARMAEAGAEARAEQEREREAQTQAWNEQRQAAAIDALNRDIGSLMADGQCDDARKAALRAGNFDLAQRVQSLCVPGPPPAQSASESVAPDSGAMPTPKAKAPCGEVQENTATVRLERCR